MELSSPSSIPFSWETSPGIPKRSSNKPNSSNPDVPLPLPPVPLRSPSAHNYSRESSPGIPKRSSSKPNSSNPNVPLPLPPVPLRSPSAHNYSWESSPGIPKRSSSKPNSLNQNSLLPLPPISLRPSSRHRYSHRQQIKKSVVAVVDPFVMALLECSKEEHEEKDNSWTNMMAGRRRRMFGFMSCKTSPSSVVDSIAYIRQKRSSIGGFIITRLLESKEESDHHNEGVAFSTFISKQNELYRSSFKGPPLKSVIVVYGEQFLSSWNL